MSETAFVDERSADPALALTGIQWADTLEALAHTGWCFCPGAVADEGVTDLLPPGNATWRLLEDEGVAHQHGYHAFATLDAAPSAVRELGALLIGSLTAQSQRQSLPALPTFNEASWTRYPPGVGQITRHRDPAAYRGVIAIITLRGSAQFRISGDSGEHDEWWTEPGHMVLFRGKGWPEAESPRPSHEVDPPTAGERIILTLRSNEGGAGAGYHL